MCSLHKEKGTLAPLHVCQKNWEGSAKSMEADIGVALVERLSQSLGIFFSVVQVWTIFMVSSEIIGTTSERNEAKFGCQNNEFCGGHSLC